MTGKRREGQRGWGRGRKWKRVWRRKRESERRQAGEKFTSTVGWSRKSCNLAAHRKQKQMSHVSTSLILPLYPSSSLLFSLSLILQMTWPLSCPPLAPLFFLLLLTIFHFIFLSFLPSFTSTSLHSLCSLPVSLMMSRAVWLVLKPDYSPQWAHFTPPGLMPASRPACGVTTDRQTAPCTPGPD